MALAIVSGVLTYEWSRVGRRVVTERRFELIPVALHAVTPAWEALPIVTTAESSGGERSLFRLGPLGLMQVEKGTYPDEEERPPEDVRLCDSSSCEESGVTLWPGAFPHPLDGGIPRGTWRLRHDEATHEWLVSYGAPDGPEHLAVAVLRLPAALAMRSPTGAVYGALCGAFVALASLLWRTVPRGGRTPGAKVDRLLTGLLSTVVLLAAVSLCVGAPARVEPSWDIQTVRGIASPSDWQSWPLVDIVRGPFTWSGTRDDERTARLGFLALRSRVVLDRIAPRETEQDARVCVCDSCIGIEPSERGGELPGSVLYVYGLRHRPGNDLWIVTYADEHREHDVGLQLVRGRHVELAEKMPWLPWICLAIAGIYLLLDVAFLAHLESSRDR